MHNAAFKALRLPAHYSLLDVTPGDIPRTLPELQTRQYGGLNITIPHKEAAYQFLAANGQLTATARLLRAVNTVVFRRNGVMLGDNTDAPGFLDALQESFRTTPRNKTVLLLGCGGAGRALGLICALRGAKAIYLADLNLATRRRLRLAIQRAAPTVPVTCVSLDRARRVAADCTLIIHATPVGMHAGDPSLLPLESFRPGHTTPPSRRCWPPPKPPVRVPPTASACCCTRARAPSGNGPAAARRWMSCAGHCSRR